MQLLSKTITRRFEESRYLFFTACLVYPIDFPLLSSIKTAAQGDERAEQTASRGGLLSRFLTLCGELLVRNWPREAVRKNIFRLARQIPHCVRPS